MNEEQLEQTALDLLEELGWETVDAFDESFGGQGTLGRDSFTEPVLGHRLLSSLRALNPHVPDEALGVAVDELTRSRAVMEPVRANRRFMVCCVMVLLFRLRGMTDVLNRSVSISLIGETPKIMIGWLRSSAGFRVACISEERMYCCS